MDVKTMPKNIILTNRVIVESPYAGELDRNINYARCCVRYCLMNGLAPYASHLLYTQTGVLNDDDAYERWLGIEAGLMWGGKAKYSFVFTDFGMSRGMIYGVDAAKRVGRPVRYIRLGPFWEGWKDVWP